MKFFGFGDVIIGQVRNLEMRMGKENKLFSKPENLNYYWEMFGLVLRGIDYTTQTFLAIYRPEETAVVQMGELKRRREAEICKRESIISNG